MLYTLFFQVVKQYDIDMHVSLSNKSTLQGKTDFTLVSQISI
jgi:hypothetical protein